MTADRDEIAGELPCHRCGYDLRVHPRDGTCPECGASVAESARLAVIPRRPAWRDSDARWRRRMLAGAWILVLVPLMNVLQTFGWAARVPVPSVLDWRGTVRTLDETYLCNLSVYQPVVFCIGVVLLFSRERGRRDSRLDWTRRWGVICSYVVLLLSAAEVLLITALVMTGIAAVFVSMPVKYQPPVTQTLVAMGTTYIRYGAYPSNLSSVVLMAFSSIAVLLACVGLFDALRSSGPRRLAACLLAPLALFALIHLVQGARFCLGFSAVWRTDVLPYAVYFSPELLVKELADLSAGLTVPGPLLGAFLMEAAKWCIALTIAIWLSVAQLAAWWQGKRARHANA